MSLQGLSFGWCEELPLSEWAKTEWNTQSKIPFHSWLQPERSEEEKERLAAMGNLVVPRQASLGASILSKLLAME